ncbi:hypothetical protein COCOBI_03-8390 [Coccomyxa sp. Obi]|nr:hypothetical protein COCOBI_03-8390 [Coccomyxa sp. Obi]
MRSASSSRFFPVVCLLLLLADLPCNLCLEQPTHGSRIGATISYMPVHERGAKMRTLQVADQEAGGTDIPVASGGSWWVPDTPTDNQAMAAPVSARSPRGARRRERGVRRLQLWRRRRTR